MIDNYQSILVPVDGSKEAEAALDKAIKIALRNGPETKLEILHVIDTRSFQNVSDFQSTMYDQVAETARKTMDGYLKQAQDAGVTNAEFTIEYGAPKSVIAEYAPKKFDTDLIVIGATGLNAMERFLIGSVTEYVVRAAKVDTLVARMPEDSEK
ncbi:nucleotide-binding universal stress UspA family protein [Weissella uvarum]|uniref:universal stress protein n=1 Tax=Weissella uvarum TaxID=1479233 RepID=UPI0019615174|nr:universal stress protein [Weissella uvarum]MBM7616506.1 nucleotide-binding universal stress UspA family protein [Weissella uvarum]MCM0595033.1 universal stress protein [Weissella uvarum]